MSAESIRTIIEQNNIATDHVVGTSGPFDLMTGELILRNTAVAADRLSYDGFAELGEPAAKALQNAAVAAKEIAPPHPADLQRFSDETDEEYAYRTGIELPLHSLQSALYAQNPDMNNPQKLAAVKRAIWLGATAFEEVVQDPAVDLEETHRYFNGNSAAAARRAERQKA